MDKHTPCVIHEDGADGTLPCGCQWWNDRRGEHDINYCQVHKAAPELLAALENVMADLDHYVSTHGPGPDKRRDNARAAICKAKGKTT
jgi:hypothetical protein